MYVCLSVTYVGLFVVIIVIFENLYSQGSVVTQLLKVWYKFSTECADEKNFENRSIFGEDMDKSLRLTFLGNLVYSVCLFHVYILAPLKENAKQTKET